MIILIPTRFHVGVASGVKEITMSIQDTFFHTDTNAETNDAAPIAFLAGIAFGALLFWIAQGTDSRPAGPDWHGNVAPSEFADQE